MQNFLKSLANCLWPISPNVTANRLDANDCLRFLIVLNIVLLSGPEVLMAADMIALLDLLGAVLFMTAFAVGYRMLGLEALKRIQRFLFPAEWTVLVKMRRHPSLVMHGMLRIGKNALLVSVITLSVVLNTIEVVRKII